MNSGEWLAARDPRTLLASCHQYQRKVGPRKARRLRLLACAAARQAWHLLSNEARSAVCVAERFADGKGTMTDLVAVYNPVPIQPVTASQLAAEAARGTVSLGVVVHRMSVLADITAVTLHAARAVATHAAGPSPTGRPTTPEWHAAWTNAFQSARACQADYVRDIFPPPIAIRREPQWMTSSVLALAREIDASGDFSALPILADALEEAGCGAEPVLRNCRSLVETHVRGNWVVDLLLSR